MGVTSYSQSTPLVNCSSSSCSNSSNSNTSNKNSSNSSKNRDSISNCSNSSSSSSSDVALNLFRLAGIITLGIQRRQSGPLQCLMGPQAAAQARLCPAVGKGLRFLCCCHKPNQDGAPCNGACGGAIGYQEALYSSATISPSSSGHGSSSKPTPAAAAAAAAAATSAAATTTTAATAAPGGSYWLNPSGKGCVLRPGDRLVIIASSVAVAECLQYATRLPWISRVYGMRSLISQALLVATGAERKSLFAPRKPVATRPSLSPRLSLLPHAFDRHKQTQATTHAAGAAFQAPNPSQSMHATQNGLAMPGVAAAASHLPSVPLSHSTAADRTTGASLVPESPRLHELERGRPEFVSSDNEKTPKFLRDPVVGQGPPRVPSFNWGDARASGEPPLVQQQNSISSVAPSSSARPSVSRWADLAGKLAHARSPATPQMQPMQQQLTSQASVGRPPVLQRPDPAAASQQLRSSVAAAATAGLCFETEEDPAVPVLGSEAVDEREQQEADSLFHGGLKQTRRQVERRVSDSSDEVFSHMKQADATKVTEYFMYASSSSISSSSSSSSNSSSSSSSNEE
ncbi:hypothetical protein Emag_007382 [Eimeria magna]